MKLNNTSTEILEQYLLTVDGKGKEFKQSVLDELKGIYNHLSDSQSDAQKTTLLCCRADEDRHEAQQPQPTKETYE